MARRAVEDDPADSVPVYDLGGQDRPPVDALEPEWPDTEHEPRRLIVPLVLGCLVLSAFVVSRLTDHQAAFTPEPPLPTYPTSRPIPGGQQLVIDGGRITDVVLGRRGVFFLQSTSGRLGRMDAGSLSAHDFTGVGVGANGLALDSDGDVLWVTAPLPGGYTDVRRFDLADSVGTLASATWTQLTVPVPVTGAVSVDGTAWLTTAQGFLAVAPAAGRPTRLRAQSVPVGTVEAVQRDIDRNRIVFTTTTPTGSELQWAGVDSAGVARTHRMRALALRDTSMALDGGALWVAGEDDGPRLTRLDVLDGSDTDSGLRPSPGGLGALDSGGAVLWWLAIGSGLSCLRPDTAAVVRTWDGVTGPVVSAVGYIYAIEQGRLERLDSSNDCAG